MFGSVCKMNISKRVTEIVLVTLLSFNLICCADCRKGDTGEEVYRVQVELLKQGYPVTMLDGEYGQETERNIKAFQKKYGLPVTGVADKETYYTLLSREHLSRDIDVRVLRLFDIATLMLTTKYSWGGENSKGFDCSGLTQYCYNCIGVDLPRTADLQYEYGRRIRKNKLRPGDLVFFSTYEPGASHCGIYLGYDKFIHAGSSKGVSIADLNNSYWSSCYFGACRVIKE